LKTSFKIFLFFRRNQTTSDSEKKPFVLSFIIESYFEDTQKYIQYVKVPGGIFRSKTLILQEFILA